MRTWAWKLGTISGIAIYVHATFLLLLGWIALITFTASKSASAVLSGLAFVILLFAIIVMHELGHALTAQRFGIRTRDITLLPIGGVARLERMPDDPKQELLVAFAGPAVNLVLAIAIYLFLRSTGGLVGFAEVDFLKGGLLPRLMWANITLAIFNLLPAFPMDGGRVLRGFLALRMDYVRATQIAAHVGQAMAFVFGFIGLFFNPFLVLIAFFVWMGAAQEASAVVTKSLITGIPVARAMITEFQILSPSDPLTRAIEHIMAGFQHDFPVVDDGRIVGVLTRSDLLTAVAQKGQAALVADVMQKEFLTASPDETLEKAFARLQNTACPALPVLTDGKLVGIVTAENVGEYLLVQEALRSRPA
jgi:Zn-dependent protease/predicted transcriptional regulator